MKVILTYLITSFAVLGCYSQIVADNNQTTSSQDKYKLIRDGLFEDSDGNIYFKTLDISNLNKPIDRFIYVVYSDGFGIDGIKEMKYVVDLGSFKSMGNDYYQDKNNIYYFHVMSDGGTMSIIDEADLKTFKVFKNSNYGIDRKYAFYRGIKLEGADIATFEPIIIEGKNQKVGWFAKDKNNYYNGYDVMTEAEIKELKEEIKRLQSSR